MLAETLLVAIAGRGEVIGQMGNDLLGTVFGFTAEPYYVIAVTRLLFNSELL